MYFASYVSYFELNKEYIIKTYCVNKNKPKLHCNGKCHLSKQLNSTITTAVDSSENQFKAMLSGFKNVFTPLFFVDKTIYSEQLVIIEFKKKYSSLITKNYSFYPSITSPPPRV